MNKKDMMKLLSSLFDGFYFHPKCVLELQSLLSHELKGKEERFFSILQTQLNNIQVFGHMIYTVDSHELLKGLSKPYVSIHLQQSQFNVRLLAYIVSGQPPIFLCAFYERGGKSATGYSKWTVKLDNRLNEMLEGEKNDEN